LVEKYNKRIEEGAKASGIFIPPPIAFNKKGKLIKRLSKLSSALSKKALSQSEQNLDTYILPHPLLGKITMREMLYFTADHVQHHQKIIERALSNK